MKLSYQQVRFFRDQGYLKIPRIFKNEYIDSLKKIVLGEIENEVPPFVRDNEEKIVRLNSVLGRNEIFYRTFSCQSILDIMEALLGPNIIILKNRHNHATLNLNNSIPKRLHRDILQWSRSVVTLILYLEDSSIENGCTEIIPGSHMFPFVGMPNNGGTWMDEYDIYKEFLGQSLPVPLEKGEILLFDSLIFHSVGENKTNDSRISITMGYHSVDELSKVTDPNKLLIHGSNIYKGSNL